MTPDEIEEITSQIDKITFGSEAERERVPDEKAGGRFRRILVAVDGSDSADKAIDWAIYLARPAEAKITAVIVLPPKHPIHGTTLPAVNPRSAQLWSDLIQEEEVAAHSILEDARERCRRAGVQVDARLERGPIVKTIARTAQDRDCDLVVVGSHGRRGLERLLLGSVAEGVRDHVHTSVLIARNHPPAQRIVLGVDGSEPSRKAGNTIAGLMEIDPARVHVVHVVHAPIEGLDPDMKEKWHRAAQDLRGPLMEHVDLPKGTWVHYDAHFGRPSEELVRVAKEDEARLIVVGARGLSGLQSLVAGSVSRRVSHEAECSVLIVK